MTVVLLPERRRFGGSRVEAMLARADRFADAAPGDEALLRGVFDVDGALAVAALTRQFDVGDAGDATWLRADPAWLRADMMTARMFAHGELGLSTAERDALLPELVELFASHGLRFDAPTPSRWYVRIDADIDVPAFAAPDAAIGDDLKLHLPAGPQGRFWRVLANDVQVLLHNHVVNRQRVERGAVAVNGLWFWGAGCLPRRVAGAATRLSSVDPAALALAKLAGIATSSTGVAGQGAVVDLRDADQARIDQVIIRCSDAGEVGLHFADGQRLRWKPRHRWRFWRRG